jgi:hypothetical protein
LRIQWRLQLLVLEVGIVLLVLRARRREEILSRSRTLYLHLTGALDQEARGS